VDSKKEQAELYEFVLDALPDSCGNDIFRNFDGFNALGSSSCDSVKKPIAYVRGLWVAA
jgi:hypothetical protein